MSQKVSHTRGPWQIATTTSEAAGRAIEARAFDGSWRTVVDRVRGGSPEESEANARLIASAPDLLAALRQAESALAVRGSLRDSEQARVQAALTRARDVLATTEGRA